MQSNFDSSMFIHHTPIGIALLLIYVNHMIIMGSYHAVIQQIMQSPHHLHLVVFITSFITLKAPIIEAYSFMLSNLLIWLVIMIKMS